VGGDANLSPRGEQYAACLGEYVNRTLVERKSCGSALRVWTSTLRRTIQTARWIHAPQERFAALNELGSGICDGMTYEEIAAQFPIEFAARDADKFHYRYPGGESYADLLQRAQPVLQRLQDEDNLLIIAHQAVIRCLLAALLGKDDQELPYIHTPLHTVMRLTFSASHPAGQVEMIPLSVECVDTHRARPEVSFTLKRAENGSDYDTCFSLVERQRRPHSGGSLGHRSGALQHRQPVQGAGESQRRHQFLSEIFPMFPSILALPFCI
jgi:broad specificity phosphatase PhoE